MFVCCECCVFSGRGLYDELITRPEESYRLWRVVVCDLETSRMGRSWSTVGRSAMHKEGNSQRRECVTVTKTEPSLLHGKIIGIYSENHKGHNVLCG
jgi:hypothetical protein